MFNSCLILYIILRLFWRRILSGLKAVCYKREYSFEDDDEKQYEERGCVEDEKFLGKL